MGDLPKLTHASNFGFDNFTAAADEHAKLAVGLRDQWVGSFPSQFNVVRIRTVGRETQTVPARTTGFLKGPTRGSRKTTASLSALGPHA